ncbi:hypothetical protein Bbelb_402580 [Branchiostoma belcheri]|nr:hypothetical protein Bbelb_402580 [Branchiostoma belcheri]
MFNSAAETQYRAKILRFGSFGSKPEGTEPEDFSPAKEDALSDTLQAEVRGRERSSAQREIHRNDLELPMGIGGLSADVKNYLEVLAILQILPSKITVPPGSHMSGEGLHHVGVIRGAGRGLSSMPVLSGAVNLDTEG